MTPRRTHTHRAWQRPAAAGWQPRYVYTPRLVGQLAPGELAIEPVLGPARVTAVTADPPPDARASRLFPPPPTVRVTWRDEHGPGRAAARYLAERSFDVRMPATADRLLIRRGIDQAVWRKQEVTDRIARLIASHLHSGRHSALHTFMSDGSIPDRLYDELDRITRQRRYARSWVDALARYCLARTDPAPVPAWTPGATGQAEARAEQWLAAAGIDPGHLADHTAADQNSRPNQRRGSLLAGKHIRSDLAAQLIDAAFTLGLEAGRSHATTPAAVLRLRDRAHLQHQPASACR
jgi:hypothetical protein